MTVTLLLFGISVVLGKLLITQISLSGVKQAMEAQPSYVQEIVPLLATIVVTGTGLAGCLVGIRFIHRKPIASVLTDGRRFGIGLMLQSAAVWGLLWLGFTLPLPGAWAGLVRRVGEIPLSWWPIIVVVSCAAMTVGRTAEEVLFRGYLLTRLSAWLKRPWLAVVLMAVGFSLFHRGNTAAHTVITFFGITWGAACVRAGSIGPMVGAHVAHDTFNILLLPRDHVADANASTTWLEAGLITIALVVWFGWLMWATCKQTLAYSPDASKLESTQPKPAQV